MLTVLATVSAYLLAVAAVVRSFLAVVDQAVLAIHACKALLAELIKKRSTDLSQIDFP
jgi:hypothetical protein